MTKTCGVCKYFEVDTVSAVCEKKRWICDDDAPACNRFEQKPKMTNGDKIRQMSNEELADFVNNRCNYCYIKEVYECDGKSCFYGVLAYLNAPAESEVEDE